MMSEERANKAVEMDRLREALGQIAALNDLSACADEDVEALARTKLYQCEQIARSALSDEQEETWQQGNLLPCPFCGAEASRITIGDDEPNNAGGDVITCNSCQASSHVEFGRKENLVSLWNARATIPQAECPDCGNFHIATPATSA